MMTNDLGLQHVELGDKDPPPHSLIRVMLLLLLLMMESAAAAAAAAAYRLGLQKVSS